MGYVKLRLSDGTIQFVNQVFVRVINTKILFGKSFDFLEAICKDIVLFLLQISIDRNNFISTIKNIRLYYYFKII